MKIKSRLNIFLIICAAVMLVVQAQFINSIDSVSNSYVFKEHKSFVPSDKIYESYIEIYKKEFELNRIQEVLTGYSSLSKIDKTKLAEVILKESKKHGVDPLFIVALIETESTFRKWARSRKGAKGLMQIRPFVGRALAKELDLQWQGNATLYDPYANVQLGTYYFSKLLNKFDRNIDVALAAYNYGPTYIARLIRKGESVPQRYANRVIKNYRNLLPSQLSTPL